MLRYFSKKGEEESKEKKKKRKNDSLIDSENENKNVKSNVKKRVKTSEKKRKPAPGHKVATRSQVEKIVKDTKQAQAKNNRSKGDQYSGMYIHAGLFNIAKKYFPMNPITIQ